jgi:poly-gamma-glutamate synthesis protein (capsule biosynthesis protein)
MKHDFSIAIVGDIFLGRGVEEIINSKGANYIFDEIRSILRKHDIVIGNLESPIGLVDTQLKNPNALIAKPEALKELRYAGFNALSLANNHILDYGPSLLGNTIEELKSCGIEFAGAGFDENEARRPLKNICGKSVSLLSYYGMGIKKSQPQYLNSQSYNRDEGEGTYNSGYLNKALFDINDLKKQTDVILVAIHWGLPGKTIPMEHQVKIAHRLIEGGAKVVIGTGPHNLQPIERYKDGVIAYSLGNFVFDHTSRENQKHSMVLSLSFRNSTLYDIRIVPILISHDYRPEPIDPIRKPILYDKIKSLLVYNLKSVDSDSSILKNLSLNSLKPKKIIRKIIRRQEGVYPLSLYIKALFKFAKEKIFLQKKVLNNGDINKY